uniref:Protein phosphatase 1 regulatory subunit 3E n=1 Tax=Pelusios castaneus TaxID=367368 RepID=A0A8C8RSZ4_9SAUR
MARAPPPPSDIPRNLSYIAGLYERAYYRTARPSLGDDSDSEAEGRVRGSRPRWRQGRVGSGGGGRQRRRARSAPAGGSGGPCRSHSPGARKRVRFADALGLELASVRRYWPAELPQVPEHVHTQLEPCYTNFLHFSPQDLQVGRPALAPCFQDPLGQPNFGVRLGAQGVCLEGVRAGGPGVAGTLRVLNLAYEKRVSIRYTWDGWASYQEAPAAYAGPAAGPPDAPPSDRFAFRLPLPPGGTLEFALHCHMGGQELWDSNEGQNYALSDGRRGSGPPNPLQDADGGWIHFL